jgi:hypothetical protein
MDRTVGEFDYAACPLAMGAPRTNDDGPRLRDCSRRGPSSVASKS